MFNPSREIYEMEFRQQDLARELENHRRVQMAQSHRSKPVGQIWATIRHGWHVLTRLRQINIAISLDLDEPCIEGISQQA